MRGAKATNSKVLDIQLTWCAYIDNYIFVYIYIYMQATWPKLYLLLLNGYVLLCFEPAFFQYGIFTNKEPRVNQHNVALPRSSNDSNESVDEKGIYLASLNWTFSGIFWHRSSSLRLAGRFGRR